MSRAPLAGSQGSGPPVPGGRADLWSGRAGAYRSAVEHAEGGDLDLIVSWCTAEAETALDVATGGGHVARALRAAGVLVTTLDPAPGMGADVIARAEDIPFADGSFDAVVTRIAAHHFDDVRLAVREMARVARGLVVVEDTLHAADDVEEAERLRDPTHVRSYSEDEWRRFLEDAGLTVEASERFEKRRPVEVWLERTGCHGELADRVRGLLAGRIVDGDYVDEKIVLKARKGT
jgi:SAM-dependent methyltransferase